MNEAPLPVIVNRSGGTASSLGDALEAKLAEAFAQSPVTLHLVDGKDVAATVEAQRVPRVAVGGGDGTLGGAAAVLAGSETALAVLPLGTRNHFARQLGVPLELADAAKVAATGEVGAVDIARAADKVFINNASVGEYTRLVRHREGIDAPKWFATIPAAWHVLRNPRPRALCLVVDGERREVVTQLLFVGNNRYSLEPGKLGERESLSDGVLSIYVVPLFGFFALLGFALRVVFSRADPRTHFELIGEAKVLTIEGQGELEIALDGEVLNLPLPLDLRIDPGALRVVTP
jgi:diacylglycerol kinase family enzyme